MASSTVEARNEAQVALELACEHLLSLQDEAGWWQGELQTNVTMDAEDMLLREFLGVRRADETERSAAWIRSQQRADGTWANFHGGPGDLSTTIEAYWALRLAGDPPDAEHMRAAAEFIREQGGVAQRARVHAPVAGAVRTVVVGATCPRCRRRSSCCRSWVPLNIYDFACWARQTIVALSLVKTHRPVRALPFDLDELRRPRRAPARAAPHAPSPRARCAGSRGPRPARLRAPADAAAATARAGARRALDRAPPGGRRLVGRHPAAVGLLADRAAPVRLSARSPGHAARPGGTRPLHGRGPATTARGVGAPAGPSRRLEACQSPVWDTALALIALSDAGLRRRPSRARARGRLAARRGGHESRRLVGRPAAASRRAAGRSSSPTSTTPTSTTPPRSCSRCAASARTSARSTAAIERARALGCRACRAPTAAGVRSTPRTPARWCASCRSWTSAR